MPAEREEINRIIMDELVCGEFKPAAIRYFQQVMEKMKRAGCEAVVLGCTEIPLIIERRQLAAADAGLDTPSSACCAASRGVANETG